MSETEAIIQETRTAAVAVADTRVAGPAASDSPAPTGRLLSLDVLRGFNMFWIIGGADLLSEIAKYVKQPWLDPISQNLTEHVRWEGFHFHDMIFPLFLFIMGVTFPFSLARREDGSATRGQLARRVVFRALALIILGLIYYGVFQLKLFDHQRMMAVLQRLVIA